MGSAHLFAPRRPARHSNIEYLRLWQRTAQDTSAPLPGWSRALQHLNNRKTFASGGANSASCWKTGQQRTLACIITCQTLLRCGGASWSEFWAPWDSQLANEGQHGWSCSVLLLPCCVTWTGSGCDSSPFLVLGIVGDEMLAHLRFRQAVGDP